MSTPLPDRKRLRASFLIACLAALAAFVAYLPALQNGFVNWDDDEYVYNNPAIQQIGPRLFFWAFFRFHLANWHPLTWFSHALDVAVWGLNPQGHHLTSVLLHAFNTFLLVLLVTRLLTIARMRAAPRTFPAFLSDSGILLAAGATGLFFGLHPLHVESVAWIAERKDLLSGLFFLLGIHLYLAEPGATDQQKPDGSPVFDRRYGLLLCCFVAALLSKPMAITFPFVLLLLDWYPLKRFGGAGALRRIVLEKVPLVLLSIGSAVITVIAQRSGNAIMSFETAPFLTRILVAARAFSSYLAKLIVPVRLAPLYPYPRQANLLDPPYLHSMLVVLVVACICLVPSKLRKPWSAFWGYYAITLLPVIGLVQIGFQSMADRYTYLPSVAPSLAAGLLASWLWHWISGLSSRAGKCLRALAPAAAAAALVLLSALTVAQIGIWKDSFTLWNYELAMIPEQNPVAYYHRGMAWASAKNYAAAISDYSAAISQNPDYYEAYNNRAVLYDALDRLEPAIRDYSSSLAIKPHYQVYYNRGTTYARMGLSGEAVADFTQSLALEPDNAGAYVNRAFAYRKLGEMAQARRDFEKGCAMGNEVGCRMVNDLGGRSGRN